MSLYTFIMEFENGTYLSQVRAESIENTRFEWIENLDVASIEHFEESDKAYILENIYDDSPTEIENLINVWCLTLLTENDKLAILNIVQTGEKSKTTNN